MSTRESISRYNLVIKKLRRQPASFQEISDYLTLESELQSYNFITSKRTFQRDIEDIRSIYNIYIQYPKDFNVNNHFKNSFGIISPNGLLPEEIILSFEPFQGKYIKSLPLHESQEILTDNEEELRIKLKLVITHDFFMEILSYGENVKVLKPEHLINDLKEAFRNALNQY